MTRKIILYFLLVFASGAVVGALGYRTYNPPIARTVNGPVPPSDWRKPYMDESKARLDLTPDQVVELKAILDDTEAKFHDARERENQEIGEIRDEHIARIRKMLTAEQLPKYEKLHAEREARAKQQNQKKQ
jgi:hypothetical protein